jgi:SAM-dependent methyltransferase
VNGSASAPGTTAQSARWDEAVREIETERLAGWRAQSDAANLALIARWLPATGLRGALKTDLFDEACATGLVGALAERADRVSGIDVSAEVVARAGRRNPELRAAVADVRALPFADGEFDCVVSNSTLDHFSEREQFAAALAELARVTAPGGLLLITLDNPLNPLIALRNRLPQRLARGIRSVPYEAGWTCGPRTLRRLLAAAGFEVSTATAIVHAPRVLVARLGARAEAGGRPARWVAGAERLERLPTRYLTGHFIAALATRTGDAAVVG